MEDNTMDYNVTKDIGKYIGGEAFRYDASLAERAADAGAALYNKGLKLAQGDDISGAITVLEQALEFSKMNIQARNLLGLCFYAVGRIGEALEHWLISQAYNKENNFAPDYIDNLNLNRKILDKFTRSIELYNTALQFFQSGSTDMAIIRLKKSVELNPSFVDAQCLLALGYMATNRSQSAESCIRKALQTDPHNPRALSYYAEITGVTQRTPKTRGTGKVLLQDDNRYAKTTVKRNIVNDFHISEIICFALGCAIVTGVFFFLVLPDREQNLKDEITTLNETIVMTRAAGDLALNNKIAEYKEVDDELLRMDNEIAELRKESELKERLLSLYSAQEYYDAGNYEMSYSMSLETGTAGFTPVQAQWQERLLHNSSAAIEAHYYSEGKKAYDKNDYDSARWFFETAMRFSQSDSPTADQSYYYLGRIAERNGETESAINYYDTVVTEYPSSNRFNDSKSRLDKLRK